MQKKDRRQIVGPAVLLCDPRFPHNVGKALRNCSCFGVRQLWVTGDRVPFDAEGYESYRLPREERMKGFKDVDLIHADRTNVFDRAEPKIVPVAVEFAPNAEVLTTFCHPENALYVFGPEDGSLGHVERSFCHRFVIIPTNHCLNLGVAVGIVLAHRAMQRQLAGLDPIPSPMDCMTRDGRTTSDS